MVAAIIALVMALVGFFTSKKAGATDAQAALAGAAAGAGTYYVGTQTEWGKDMVSKISDWVGVTDSNGEPITNADGKPASIPKGATVVLDSEGNPARDPQGNVIWKLVDEAGNVLKSWGPTGTASVIGAGAFAASAEEKPWLWLAGAGILLLLVAE